LGYTAFLINFSDKPHPHLVGAHNDDLVVAGTKLYKPLPRTDRRCARKAVILVVTTVGNINFPHHIIPLMGKMIRARHPALDNQPLITR